ncbi:MAG: hypothetical protein EOO73_27755 [Myxococcales bacterium]|nr:MAG: hypothetical protein EOO73_27755 [Myxococcales bacterium]
MRCALLALVFALGCSDPLQVGDDLLWTADTESGNLEQWTGKGAGEALAPVAPALEDMPDTGRPSSVEVTTEAAHRGGYAVKLVNPTGWNDDFEGPELVHDVGPLADAYYSAWYLVPEEQRVIPYLTVMRLRSRDETGKLENGEELQLRSLASGEYVLSVFSNNAGFLLEPVADPPPLVAAGRWFHLEARYEPQSAGRLRVWLDGTLRYDLTGRPGATTPELVFGVCNAGQLSDAAVVLFVDDAAISLSRVGASGKLAAD